MAATARDVDVEAKDAPTLSWEDIQAKAEASAKTARVVVDEWGGAVTVRGLYLSEARDVRERVGEDPDPALVAIYTVAYGCVSPRIPFDEAMRLGEQATGVIFKLFKAIDNLTGVSDQEVRAATEAFRDS